MFKANIFIYSCADWCLDKDKPITLQFMVVIVIKTCIKNQRNAKANAQEIIRIY